MILMVIIMLVMAIELCLKGHAEEDTVDDVVNILVRICRT